jgi:hypothetical protein
MKDGHRFGEPVGRFLCCALKAVPAFSRGYLPLLKSILSAVLTPTLFFPRRSVNLGAPDRMLSLSDLMLGKGRAARLPITGDVVPLDCSRLRRYPGAPSPGH